MQATLNSNVTKNMLSFPLQKRIGIENELSDQIMIRLKP